MIAVSLGCGWIRPAVDSAAAAGDCGQLVDGRSLRITPDHDLTTATLDNPALRSGLPTAAWKTTPLRSAVSHTAHSFGDGGSIFSFLSALHAAQDARSACGQPLFRCTGSTVSRSPFLSCRRPSRQLENQGATTGKNSCRRPAEVVDARQPWRLYPSARSS